MDDQTRCPECRSSDVSLNGSCGTVIVGPPEHEDERVVYEYSCDRCDAKFLVDEEGHHH